jgi:hypothetical protein
MLWQSVLLQVLRDIRDANRSHEGHKDFVTAARWVGTYPSREFNEVCMLAGLEPDFVHPRFVKIIKEAEAKSTARKTAKKAPVAVAAE